MPSNTTLPNAILIINYVNQADVLFLYSILGLICIITLSLCIYYRKQQPVKSRYILLFFGPTGVLFFCAYKIIVACVYIYDPYVYQQNSIINATTTYQILFYTEMGLLDIFALPIIQLTYFLYLCQSVHYFLIRNMYSIIYLRYTSKRNRKAMPKSVSEDLNVLQRSMKRKLAIYSILTSRTMLSIACILFLFTCVMVAVVIRILPFIPELTNKFSNDFSKWILSIYDLGVRAACAVIIILIVAWDVFIMSCSKLFRHCRWRQHFMDEDPFRFRIEFFIILALNTFAIGTEAIYFFIMYTPYRFTDLTYHVLLIAAEQIRFLYFLCILAVCGGFVIILKLIELGKKLTTQKRFKVDGYSLLDNSDLDVLFSPEVQNTAMYTMLRDPHGYDVFQQFCQYEVSLENLMSWKDLQRILRTYKIDKYDEERKMNMIMELYNNYIDSESKYTVNIRSDAQQLMNQVADGRINDPALIKRALITLNNCLQENLTDSFSRLVATEMYKKYITTRQLQLEMRPRPEFRSNSNRLVEPDSITTRR